MATSLFFNYAELCKVSARLIIDIDVFLCFDLPRPWKVAEDPEFDQDRPLSPPSPINQTEFASHEAATQIKTPNKRNASEDPQHDNLEMLPRSPPKSEDQKKKKSHSPIVYNLQY